MPESQTFPPAPLQYSHTQMLEIAVTAIDLVNASDDSVPDAVFDDAWDKLRCLVHKKPTCSCWTCVTAVSGWLPLPMIVCETCGNKRCPHGTNHVHACTNSNEPGQPGSRY